MVHDTRRQLKPVRRLHNQVCGAERENARTLFGIVEPSLHDDRRFSVSRHCAQCAAQLKTVHARHGEISDHDVRRFSGDHLQRFDAVAGGADIVAARDGEKTRHERPHLGDAAAGIALSGRVLGRRRRGVAVALINDVDD